MANAIVEQLISHPLVYRDEPVVTFKMIDEMHERPEGTAQQAFTRNKRQFKEGIDYNSIPFKEFQQLTLLNRVNSETRGNPAKPVFLFTEIGYTMLTKSFKDDRSYAIMRELVQHYFKSKRQSAERDGFSSVEIANGLTAISQAVQSLTGMFGTLLLRVEKLEGRGAIGTTIPRFATADRLNELLQIHDINPPKTWRSSVTRRIHSKAIQIGIELFQNSNTAIEMPMQHQPWAEKRMLEAINSLLDREQMPLFPNAGQ